jgi:hypothetical protein
MMALEAALSLAGISPDEFYAFVGRAEDTIKIIVEDPGAFIGNVIDSVSMGFGQFSDNFVDHLQTGFIDWLTGQAGDAGITMPDELDLSGILDITLQVMGLTPEHLREKAEEHLGEEAVGAIEFVWGFIDAAIQGGLDGLWEHLQEHLSTLWDDVIGQIQDWITEKIIVAAVTKIASMFNPVGAIVQAILTAWNLYTFVRDQIQRIWGVFTAVVNGIGDIARGSIGGAADMVEGALASLVPVAIDLLAKLLGIGGIGAKVREIIEGVQDMVDEAIDKMIEKIKGLFGGDGGDAPQEGEAPAEGEGAFDGEIGETVRFEAEGESHRLWVDGSGGGDPVVNVASRVMTVPDRLADWEARKGLEPSDVDGQGGPSDAAAATSALGSAQASYGTVLVKARETQQATGDAAAESDEQTEAAQGTLARDLTALFGLYQDEANDGDAVMERFAAQIGLVHPDARELVTAAIGRKLPELGDVTDWSAARAILVSTGDLKDLADKPANGSTAYAQTAHAQLLAVVQDLASTSHFAPENARSNANGYVTNPSKGRLNGGEGLWGPALAALRDQLWGEASASAVDRALRDAFDAQFRIDTPPEVAIKRRLADRFDKVHPDAESIVDRALSERAAGLDAETITWEALRGDLDTTSTLARIRSTPSNKGNAFGDAAHSQVVAKVTETAAALDTAPEKAKEDAEGFASDNVKPKLHTDGDAYYDPALEAFRDEVWDESMVGPTNAALERGLALHYSNEGASSLAELEAAFGDYIQQRRFGSIPAHTDSEGNAREWIAVFGVQGRIFFAPNEDRELRFADIFADRTAADAHFLPSFQRAMELSATAITEEIEAVLLAGGGLTPAQQHQETFANRVASEAETMASAAMGRMLDALWDNELAMVTPTSIPRNLPGTSSLVLANAQAAQVRNYVKYDTVAKRAQSKYVAEAEGGLTDVVWQLLGEYHHFIPLYLGGGNEEENLLPAFGRAKVDDLSTSAHAMFHDAIDQLTVEARLSDGTAMTVPLDVSGLQSAIKKDQRNYLVGVVYDDATVDYFKELTEAELMAAGGGSGG